MLVVGIAVKMAKRSCPFEEFEDVSKVSCTSPNAKIHDVVDSLSPMRSSKSSSCSYFDGEITDGKATMRFFGFDAGVRRRLVEFEDSKKAVTLTNCEVKRARRGENLEVLVSKKTEVEKSEKVFEVESVPAKTKKMGKIIMLKELNDLVPYQVVSVEVKVVRVEEPAIVGQGMKKQDLLIGDSTGNARLALWETEVGTMEEEGSYRLGGLMVRELRKQKFLSTSKQSSIIEKISDIGDVEEGDSDEGGSSGDNFPGTLHNVRVVRVVALEKYSGCIKCTAKVTTDEDDPELGKCVNCGMLQCIDTASQQLRAQLMIKGVGNILTLRAFGKVVESIAQKPAEDVTMAVLLKAAAFDVVHRDGIVRSITRKA